MGKRMRWVVFAIMTVVFFLGMTFLPSRAYTLEKSGTQGTMVQDPFPESKGRFYPLEGQPGLQERENSHPLDKGVEDIEKQMESLMEELKKLERDVKDKVRKDVLPRLKQEIERLREWLRKTVPKKDQNEPIRT